MYFHREPNIFIKFIYSIFVSFLFTDDEEDEDDDEERHYHHHHPSHYDEEDVSTVESPYPPKKV